MSSVTQGDAISLKNKPQSAGLKLSVLHVSHVCLCLEGKYNITRGSVRPMSVATKPNGGNETSDRNQYYLCQMDMTEY